MSSVLPFFALMSVPRNRRRRLLPLALPAVAGVPAAQAGALGVVAADSAARREGNAATTEAAADLATVLTIAVDKGAALEPADLKDIPLAVRVLAEHPDILKGDSHEAASRADLERAMAVIKAAMADRNGVTAVEEEIERPVPRPARAKTVAKG